MPRLRDRRLRGAGPVTLIVSATFDDSNPEWYDALPEPKVRMSTAGGGHPSAAFVKAYRQHDYDSYLFIQDSMEPLTDNPVAPFVENGNPVVAWAHFPLFFDTPDQRARVVTQYPGFEPPVGIFGPVFFAKRWAMAKLDKLNLFPLTPRDKLDAQGTERAWAFAFMAAGIPQGALGMCVTDGVRPNLFPADGPFRKHFAGRA